VRRLLVLTEKRSRTRLELGERKDRPHERRGTRKSSWKARLWHSRSPSSHAWASKPADGGVTPTTISRGIP
jgi:hypothetical protein